MVAVSSAGCFKSLDFVCGANADCVQTGVPQGTCEPVGYCSFPDPSCAEGRRYAGHSGPYTDQCVGGELRDAGPDSDVPDGPRADARPDGAVASSPWTLLHFAGSATASITVTATGVGHLIVVAVETDGSTVTSITDNASNTYVAVPSARSVNTTGGFAAELWYAKASLAGATTITPAASKIYASVAWEVSGINATSPLDTATKVDDQAASTMPAGASITTSVAGDFVVSAVIVAKTISGIHAGNEFTNDLTTFGNGWAHLTSSSAPAAAHQASWDQNMSGAYCSSTAAFFAGP